MSLTLVAPLGAQPPDGAIGLLALRQFEGAPCKEPPPAVVALYAKPQTAEAIGWIRADKHPLSDDECYQVVLNAYRQEDGNARELPTKEYEEEEPDAAIVLEQHDGFFKVRLEQGAAWLQASPRDVYFPLLELLQRRPAYLTDAWDGTIADTPGGRGSGLPVDPRRRAIGYVTPVLDGTAWIDAFERTDRGAPAVATLNAQDNTVDHPLRSTRQNPAQVPVFDRRPGWLQVALEGNKWREDQRVWIEEAAFWRFRTFRSDPERDTFENEVDGRQHSSVRVTGAREHGGTLWLQVEVMSHTIYDSDEPPRVVRTGWVPAYDSKGALTVWFYSRD